MWLSNRGILVISVWWTCLSSVLGDTILYTNSPRHLVTSENYTSYKLAVPGANPITIIEATQGPPSDGEGDGSLSEMRRQNWVRDEEFLFRRKKDDDKNDDEHIKPRTTVYSPDLLKKFLDDYADKVRKPSHEKKEKLQEILLFDDGNEEENFPLNSQPEEKYSHQDWNKYDNRRYDRPNSGWVTMDVIPWSSSKVSKWQGNVQRLPNRPESSRPDYVSMESFDDRFSSQNYNNYRPNRPSQPDFDHVDRFSSPPSYHSNDQYSAPSRYPEKRPYYDYQSSASHVHPYPSTPDRNKHQSRPWGSEIITDNRAPDFPEHYPTYPNTNRHPGGSSYEHTNSGEYRPYESDRVSRPTANPESGNGEWILVSTTKGYHRPRHGQRAVAVKPQSFSGHKSVHLAVTAGKPQSAFSFDSNTNRPEDQSGDESVQVAATEPVKILPTVQKQQKKVIKKVLNVKTPGVDSSAVLAAVSAGMVPATVAMLMPMIAGRRKKRDLFAAASAAAAGRLRNVTQFPDLDYEATLPRILQKHVR